MVLFFCGQNFVKKQYATNNMSKISKVQVKLNEKIVSEQVVASTDEDLNLMDTYLQKADWQIKENSNMAFSLQGMRNYVNNEITKKYWLEQIYPERIAKAHKSGDLHIHDLSELASYCCGWDLEQLLMLGFTGVPGKVVSRPAKHFGSALGQIVNFIYTLQGEAAGAMAFSNFDTLLAPFVRYDNLSYKEVKQELQSFVYNCNVPTRVGFQTPFFNITMDVDIPKYFAEKQVISGGKPQTEKYGEFQKEVDMVNQAFADVMMEGDGNGQVFTFPIPTYNITKEFDWDDNRFDKIWEMTAKYGIPYFANYVNSDMNPEDARSMCCRLRLDNRELRKRGGLFAANPMTGSIGVVTINLPRNGFTAKDKEGFKTKLKELMDVARDSLEIKREIIENMTEKGLYPYTKFYLKSVKERNGAYWGNHFSTIGLLGMNEACLNLIGKDIATPEGQEFSKEILTYMRDTIINYQEETGNLYNLEATPGEGTSYRFARLDTEKFANDEIEYANTKDVKEGKAVPYYTNSSQLPVGHTEDFYEAVELQDKLQTLYTGGTVLHGFIGEKLNDIQTVKELVRRTTSNYEMPYFTITPTFSISPTHGYLAGEHFTCPHSGEPCQVYSRVVGYIRPVQQWNDGKVAEFHDRKTFKAESNCKTC